MQCIVVYLRTLICVFGIGNCYLVLYFARAHKTVILVIQLILDLLLLLWFLIACVAAA